MKSSCEGLQYPSSEMCLHLWAAPRPANEQKVDHLLFPFGTDPNLFPKERPMHSMGAHYE